MKNNNELRELSLDEINFVSGGAAQTIVLGLSDLLTGLGILGPVKAGVTADGLLGPGTSGSVNNLLNDLSVGPNNY